MLYECSCGFTAASATAFYKHLASSKDSGGGHQLTQARFAGGTKDTKRANSAAEARAKGALVPAAVAAANWVDEYMFVDQREPAAQPVAANQSSGFTFAKAGVPVSVSARSLQQQQSRPAPATPLDPEPHETPRGWGIGRQHSDSRRSSTAGARGAVPAAPLPQAQPLQPPVVDTDEVELVERASGHARQGHRASLGGSGSHAAQAALRMSVNAVVVGLSPWRWFGSPNAKGAEAGAHTAKGPHDAAALEEEQQQDSAGPLPERSPSVQPQAESTGSLLEERGHAFEADDVAVYASHECGPSPASLDAVQTVRDVLTWRNPWHTCRVFGAGLYLAICVRQLVKGHDLLQPSTALFAFCFLLLLRNAVREAMARYRRSQQQGFSVVIEEEDIGDVSGQGEDDRNPPSPSLQALAEAERRKAALQLQQRVEDILRPAALGAARYGAALVVLGVGLLSGRRAITTALVAALLWLGMVVGELRVMSQPTFWLLCYIAAFTVPAAYSRCRRAMDAGVEAALRFVVRVLVGGSRGSLLAAGTVAAVLLAVLPLNFVLRASLAGASGFGVLLWQSELGGRGGAGEVRRLASAGLSQEVPQAFGAKDD